MNKMDQPKLFCDYEKLLIEVEDLLIEDPNGCKAAEFVLELLEENIENWRFIRELYREAVSRVWFEDG